jgi:hypothetical protein
MRDGAGQATIPPAFGNIIAMMTMEHRIYLIGERGVSSGVMADQIDPQRQNVNIPQIVQREELTYGANTQFLQKTLCTAVSLLQPTHLPTNFLTEAALMLTLKISQDLAAVADVIGEFRQHEAATRDKMAQGEVTRKHLPRTPNLKGRVEQAISHLRKVQVGIMAISGYFYPKQTQNAPWIDSVKAGLAQDDPFREYINVALPALEEISNCRNAMIHGDDMKRLEINDYDLGADGIFIAPTLEVIHPQSPLSRRDVIQYLDHMKDRLVDVFAMFLSVFCDRNVRSVAPMFDTHVIELPNGELRAGSPFVWETRMKEGFSLTAPSPAK